MEPVTKVLVVANRTSSTPKLLDEVRRRAHAKPCSFTLLIPDAGSPSLPGAASRAAADWTLTTALPLLSRAAHGEVDSRVGGPDPFTAVQEAIADGGYDEVIISTLPRRTSKWLRRDLVRRVQRLGVPVTAIVPGRAQLSREEQLELMGTGSAVT
jgi:hypothetical protein